MKKLEKVFLEGNEPKPENKINVYTCPRGHKMVTVDREEGTTSMTKTCMELHNGRECGEVAYSSWYKCDQTLEPKYEWYRPEPTAKLSKAERDHCKQGGLLLRRIGQKPATPPAPENEVKVGRNEPCPCGSMTTGKNPRPVKFKHCHINDPAGLTFLLIQKQKSA